ncbi:hypothetical protein [Actinopolymorpha pittospori]|uniref:Uncharacterized protein n=1 Tax=Actinopolymorpha pittospori TaxID=648752 RepID=A0A927MYM6_9ACTN|nr:hypothetical protein [Actinopolymorpha pittospori]MBE1605727.1 hypothetical protein [Actinopolymorpha pittospori]
MRRLTAATPVTPTRPPAAATYQRRLLRLALNCIIDPRFRKLQTAKGYGTLSDSLKESRLIDESGLIFATTKIVAAQFEPLITGRSSTFGVNATPPGPLNTHGRIRASGIVVQMADSSAGRLYLCPHTDGRAQPVTAKPTAGKA